MIGLDDWTTRHLDRLAEMESRWEDACTGDALVHLDVRSDNIVIARDGRVFFVDWAHSCTGAPWLDLLLMLPSVTLEGGPHPETVWMGRRRVASVDREAVTTVVVGMAGYFTERSLLPPPPGLPYVRAFQAAQGEVARGWIRTRTGWT